ncbi:DMT family transporter [Clostridium sp. WILCCON 0269]|uniref:DMT family transporter n=1 Tax=Candidatus Clostridium eludens TaxID=3381663 RepID=A0ABW8SNB2_9CLOT
MNYKRKSIISSITLGLVALLWGTSYAIIKDILNDIKPFTLMSLRFGISTIFLFILFPNKLKNITKKDILHGILIGIFLFFAFLTLVIGIFYTTASKQSFLVGAYVLIVPFLGWIIYKAPPNIYSVLGAVLAVFGIGLLTLNGSFYINKGDLLSILCSFSFACHMIAIEYFNKDSDPIILTIIQFSITSLLFITLTGIFESFSIEPNLKVLKSIAYLTIFTTVIPFLVQNIAQKYISSTSTALILTLESAFGGIFAVILLNEVMSFQMLIGCILIFTGIVTQTTKLNFLKKIKIHT